MKSLHNYMDWSALLSLRDVYKSTCKAAYDCQNHPNGASGIMLSRCNSITPCVALPHSLSMKTWELLALLTSLYGIIGIEYMYHHDLNHNTYILIFVTQSRRPYQMVSLVVLPLLLLLFRQASGN